MDFTKKPGDEIKVIGELKEKLTPTISIITPFYNGGKTLEETYNSVLSQTYPFFEWIIVDDGSKDKESLDKLAKLSKKDSRIKVFHKENGGPAQARDYGIEKSSSKTKYIFFLDCDDIIANTMLECMYWTLETHPEASFTYTSMINFGARCFYWEPYFTLKQQKEDNLICISSMVKKSDLLQVGCFGVKEKAMYEDWNLWLKLLAAGKIPIRMNAPVFWYRTSDAGEFSRAKQNHERAMKVIRKTAKTIKKKVEAIQFPRIGKEVSDSSIVDSMTLPEYKKKKEKTILFILPWTVVGGADIFNLELIKRMHAKGYNCIVVTTLPIRNALRQDFEDYVSEFYDLSTFLDNVDYQLFVNYLVKSRNVDITFVSNTVLGYALLPGIKEVNPDMAVVDYIHSIDLLDSRGGFGKYTREFEGYIDATFACNNFTTEQLVEDYGRKDAKTIYIGTDHERFDAKNYNSEKLKKEHNLDRKKKVISFVARLSYEKRPLLFLKIAELLLKEHDDLTFLIAGDGPMGEEVREKIQTLGLSAHVKMLGMVSDSGKVYSMSDVTINCSLLEGLALTSYESLSMGVPVVSVDIGGQSELINEKVGRIIPFLNSQNDDEMLEEAKLYVNAVNEVLDDLKKYKAQARKRVLDGFTLDNMGEKFDKVFKDITPSKKNPRKKDDVYKNYAKEMRDYFDGMVKLYVKNNLNIDNPSFLWKVKNKFLKLGIRYNIEKELRFVFKTMRFLYHGIKSLVMGLIKILLFVVCLIPTFIICIYVFFVILLKKIKE